MVLPSSKYVHFWTAQSGESVSSTNEPEHLTKHIVVYRWMCHNQGLISSPTNRHNEMTEHSQTTIPMHGLIAYIQKRCICLFDCLNWWNLVNELEDSWNLTLSIANNLFHHIVIISVVYFWSFSWTGFKPGSRFAQSFTQPRSICLVLWQSLVKF